ncbi:MAG: MEDS domain-containing protein [Spirochaetota bacterium]
MISEKGVHFGDLELYSPSERSEDNFRSEFAAPYLVLADTLSDPDMFNIMSPSKLYFPDGVFSPAAMDDGLDAYYRESQRNGHRHMRTTAKMLWALDAAPGRVTTCNRMRYFYCSSISRR